MTDDTAPKTAAIHTMPASTRFIPLRAEVADRFKTHGRKSKDATALFVEALTIIGYRETRYLTCDAETREGIELAAESALLALAAMPSPYARFYAMKATFIRKSCPDKPRHAYLKDMIDCALERDARRFRKARRAANDNQANATKKN